MSPSRVFPEIFTSHPLGFGVKLSDPTICCYAVGLVKLLRMLS
jgi:hypothetical protein